MYKYDTFNYVPVFLVIVELLKMTADGCISKNSIKLFTSNLVALVLEIRGSPRLTTLNFS